MLMLLWRIRWMWMLDGYILVSMSKMNAGLVFIGWPIEKNKPCQLWRGLLVCGVIQPSKYVLRLLLVAIAALGGAALGLVAVFAQGVSGVLVEFDFGRLALVTGFAAKFVGMGFVVESDVAVFCFENDGVSSQSSGGSKSNEHCSNKQFLHDETPINGGIKDRH